METFKQRGEIQGLITRQKRMGHSFFFFLDHSFLNVLSTEHLEIGRNKAMRARGDSVWLSMKKEQKKG